MSSYWYWAGFCCLLMLSWVDGAWAADGLIAVGMPGAHGQTRLMEQGKALHMYSRVLLEARDGGAKGSGVSPRKVGTIASYAVFGVFALASLAVLLLGVIVLVQWPNPGVCCFTTPHADTPAPDSCGCCALHRLNIGFTVAWLALLALLLLAQIIPLVAACGALAVLHAVVAYALIGALRAAQRVEQLWLQQQQQQQEHLYRDEEAWGSAAVPMAHGPPVPLAMPGVAVPGIPLMARVPMHVAEVGTLLGAQQHAGSPHIGGASVVARSAPCTEAAAAADVEWPPALGVKLPAGVGAPQQQPVGRRLSPSTLRVAEWLQGLEMAVGPDNGVAASQAVAVAEPPPSLTPVRQAYAPSERKATAEVAEESEAVPNGQAAVPTGVVRAADDEEALPDAVRMRGLAPGPLGGARTCGDAATPAGPSQGAPEKPVSAVATITVPAVRQQVPPAAAAGTPFAHLPAPAPATNLQGLPGSTLSTPFAGMPAIVPPPTLPPIATSRPARAEDAAAGVGSSSRLARPPAAATVAAAVAAAQSARGSSGRRSLVHGGAAAPGVGSGSSRVSADPFRGSSHTGSRTGTGTGTGTGSRTTLRATSAEDTLMAHSHVIELNMLSEGEQDQAAASSLYVERGQDSQQRQVQEGQDGQHGHVSGGAAEQSGSGPSVWSRLGSWMRARR